MGGRCAADTTLELRGVAAVCGCAANRVVTGAEVTPCCVVYSAARIHPLRHPLSKMIVLRSHVDASLVSHRIVWYLPTLWHVAVAAAAATALLVLVLRLTLMLLRLLLLLLVLLVLSCLLLRWANPQEADAQNAVGGGGGRPVPRREITKEFREGDILLPDGVKVSECMPLAVA